MTEETALNLTKEKNGNGNGNGNKEDENKKREGPGSDFVTFWHIIGLLVYLLAFTWLLVWQLREALPTCLPKTIVTATPTPSATPKQSPTPTPSASPTVTPTVTPTTTPTATPAITPTVTPTITPSPTSQGSAEQKTNQPPACPISTKELLWLLMLAGALGSTAHAFISLSAYVCNRELKQSWMLMYVLLPWRGAALAGVYCLIILGGFLPQSVELPWPGLVAIATLVGLFSDQAASKLKVVAEAIFTTPPNNKDPLQPDLNTKPPSGKLKITKVEPDHGKLKSELLASLTGSGFTKETRVAFGHTFADQVEFVSATQIKAKTPIAQQPGQVDVTVSNPDGQSAKLADGYTYQDEAQPDGNPG